MAKVTMPLMSATASGKIGTEIVFDKRGHVRKYVVPANPQTVGQMAQRNLLADIQAELFALGTVLRAQLKSEFGYRWNSLIIKELLDNAASKITSLAAVYAAFQAAEKTEWSNGDTITPAVRTKGELLFMVAQATYDIGVRIGATISLTDPANNNGTTVAAEWVDNTP